MGSDNYILDRGYLASARLNFQFYQWKDTMGYILHPSIPINQPNLKVADVGTGTGVWLCELSRYAPESTSLDGYDISSQQFPHANSLPENVTLNILDATKPPPEHLWHTYDVVHVRLLFTLIRDNDPSAFLDHCIKLLKPGGYLQWDEHDMNGSQPAADAADIPCPCISSLAQMWKLAASPEWIPKLPDIFQQNGLSVVAAESYREQKWQRHMSLELWFLVGEEFATGLEKKGDYEQARKYRDTIKGAYEELKQGAVYTHLLRVAVGRLPEH